MATTTWYRQFATAQGWVTPQLTSLIVKLNSGQTILRSHLAWGFGGYTWTRIFPTSVMGNIMAFGMVTTIGNGLETVPDPQTSTGNASDPSQRWLWWQVRAPTCVSWDSANNSAIWQSSPPEEESTTKGQVLAPSGMGSGNTLNLWLTWRPFGAWDASGQAILWFKTSTLVRSP